jgi:sec-independent protein translocase protein TatA
MPNIGAPELIIILVVVMLFFGAARLPKLAKSLGEASKEFKDAVKDGADGTAAPPSKTDDTKPSA